MGLFGKLRSQNKNRHSRLRVQKNRRSERPSIEHLETRCLLSGQGLVQPTAIDMAKVGAAYARLPLSFVPNSGQFAGPVQFASSGSGYSLFLTSTGATFSLQTGGSASTAVQMQLQGANPNALGAGLSPDSSTSNYYLGNDSSQWRTNIANYGRVRFDSVYAGVGLTYYGNQNQLEYDFDVAPGADAGQIHLSFPGAQSLSVDGNGNLVVHLTGGDLVQHAPVIYQTINGQQHSIAGSYQVGADGTVGFQIGAYDHTQTLVIDPLISYATYLGGSGVDSARAITVDGAGNMFVTGSIGSAGFPVVGGPQGSLAGKANVFVSVFKADGSGLLYSTYFGGGGTDTAYAIQRDPSGNIYVAGNTTSSNFPTKNPIQSFGGGVADAFVFKLNNAGGLVFSTFLGGNDTDFAQGLAIDAAQNVYVVGFTFSKNFPTANAMQPTSGGGQDGFITELDSSGTGIIFSTYLGGATDDSIQSIQRDAAGNLVIAGDTLSPNFPTKNSLQSYGGGDDGFVAKLTGNASALIFSTYLGGSSDDRAGALRLDAAGNIYVGGSTSSANFPTKNPLQSTYRGNADAFLVKYNPSGSAMFYSTYLGGSQEDRVFDLALDAFDDVYLVGTTASANFPTVHPAQAALSANNDAFLAKIDASGSVLAYSSFMGGHADDRAFAVTTDANDGVYIVGSTSSSDFPSLHSFQPNASGIIDGFVMKFLEVPATQFSVIAPVTTAGNLFSITIDALSQQGTLADAYRGTVHFSSSDPLAVLPPDYTFTGADSGVHLFTGVQLKTPGSQSITVTDILTPELTGTRSGIIVGPLVKSFTLTGVTSPATAGASGSITVTARDAQGNLTPGYTGTVHFSSSDLNGILPADYTFVSADNGVHTFTGVVFKTPGIQSVTVDDVALPAVRGTLGGITVNPVPVVAKAFLVSGVPSSVLPGTAQTFIVKAVDNANQVVPGYTGTVHFSSSDGLAILPANYTFIAADNGVHTFTSGVTFNTSGSQSLSATDIQSAGVTGSQTGITVAQVISGLQVSATGSPTTGAGFGLTLKVVDADGNVVPTYTGTVHLSSSDTQSVLPGDFTFSALDAGVHTFTVTFKKSGNQTVTFQDLVNASFSATVGLSVTALATHFVATSAPTVVAGKNLAVTIKAVDDFNNTATGYSGTVHLSSTDAKAQLVGDYTFTSADQGTKTFPSLMLATAGPQSITVKDAANASIGTGTANVTVNPAAVASLSFLTQPTTGISGKVQTPPIKVQLFDAFGNLATNSAAQVSIVAVSAAPGVGVGGTTAVTPVNGVAQFANLTVTGFGIGVSLQARSGSVAANSFTFNNIVLSSILPVVVTPVIFGPHPNTSQVNSYVKGVYRTLLGRDADPVGLGFWIGEINSGTPRTAIIESFWNSPENRGREVDAYYQAYLGRNAEQEGRDY